MLDLGLVAEHGAWTKEMSKDWRMIKPLISVWKPQIISILELYVDRLHGSFIEEKEFSVAWHYRKADLEQGSILAKELIDYIANFTANMGIQVSQGHKVVEIRNSGVNKGASGLYWMSKKGF